MPGAARRKAHPPPPALAPPPAGIPAGAAREFLLQSAELDTWALAWARKTLGLDADATRQAVATLEALGYVERVPGRRETFHNTAAGDALAGVSKAPPIRRAIIGKAVQSFLGRVVHVNHDPRFLYRVEKVVLFGPFLTTNADRVKNADLAVQLSPKERDPARLDELVHEHAAEAERGGHHFQSFAGRLRWGEAEVRNSLKGRVRARALHGMDTALLSGEHKVLFETAPKA